MCLLIGVVYLLLIGNTRYHVFYEVPWEEVASAADIYQSTPTNLYRLVGDPMIYPYNF